MNEVWHEDIHPVTFIRFDSMKWLNIFLKEGSILFGNAQKWINLEDREDQRGKRGDCYEGTLCACHTRDRFSIAKSKAYYHADVTQNIEGGITLIKNSQHLRLPTYCFYALKTEDFIPVPGEKNVTRTFLSGEMFTSFNQEMSEEEVATLPEEDKPGVMLINNPSAFIDRLTEALIAIGVKENELFFDKVKYFEMRNEPGNVDRIELPLELYCKDRSYRFQKEGRIVINTRNKKVLERLKEPLFIGNLEDIATVDQWYLTRGMQIIHSLVPLGDKKYGLMSEEEINEILNR